MRTEEILRVVKERYDKAALRSASPASSCCCPTAGPAKAGFATEHGLYAASDLTSVPNDAVALSRGCGNPVSFANLRPGEVVVDFGSGGGLDAILAARKVRPGGKVIGVDFAPHMVEQARHAVGEADLSGSIELITSDLSALPLPDASADVVISNCVINLCPDKAAVYREAYRILKRGGRLAISDVVYSENPAADVRSRLAASWVGCLGGSIDEPAYFELIERAGFKDIRVVARHRLETRELDAIAKCPGPEFSPEPTASDLAAVEGKVVSVKFTAVKG